MKVITLTQPWATLMILGLKTIETRSWKTDHRGPIAIHAAKGFPRDARDFAFQEFIEHRLPIPPRELPLGAVLGYGVLTGIDRTENIVQSLSGRERRYGDYSTGRYGWRIDNIQAFDEPIPAKGALSLWEWQHELIAEPESMQGNLLIS